MIFTLILICYSIFQSLIFTKVLYQHGMKYTINFNKHNLESSKYNTICSTKVITFFVFK